MDDDLRLLADVFPDVPPPGERARQLVADRLAVALSAERNGRGRPNGPPSHRRRRVLIGSAIAVPVAAALVVLTLMVVPGPTRPPLAAAAVLHQAAAAAGQAQSTPGPGQYEYTETETRYRITIYAPQGGDAPLVEKGIGYQDETNQAWTGAAGRGRHRVSVGSPHFPSASAQALWKAGQDAVRTRPHVTLAGAGQALTQQPILSAVGLPTDPAKLASYIAAQKLQVSPGATGNSTEATSSNAYHLHDGRPYSVFEGAATLLVGPTAGMTPALASALFQVMAEQPGVRSLGTVTDHNGQAGQGVATSAPSTEVDQVVVDPTTGRVLEARFAPPPTTFPQIRSCLGAPGQPTTSCVTHIQTHPVTATTPTWTDVVASGIVSSPTATVPSIGTIRPVVTAVPGPPTHVVVTDLPGAGEGVRVSWTPPAHTGTGPVTGYVLHEANANGGFELPITGGHTTATEYTFRGGTPAGTYTVQAQNAEGTGPASAPAKGPPATPTDPAPQPAVLPGVAPG